MSSWSRRAPAPPHGDGARCHAPFGDETLWPEFLELSEVLNNCLDDVTNRLLARAIHKDEGKEEEFDDDALNVDKWD